MDSRTSLPEPPTQLETWRAIAVRRHQSDEPVSTHVDFIRKCIEDLDGNGFSWTKESVVEMMFRAGLPANFPDDDASAFLNEILGHPAESPLSNQIINAKVQVLRVESSLADAKPTTGFLQLPEDLLLKIAGHVKDISRLEMPHILDERGRRVLTVDDRERGKWISCWHDEAPILNSIQSLAAVNKKLYGLCSRLLWKKLSFPTAYPAPIELWTDEILPKNGEHVQFLSVGLARLHFKHHRDIPSPEWMPHDNTDIDGIDDVKSPLHMGYRRVGISPENLRTILELCPNLRSLDITYPDMKPSESDNWLIARKKARTPIRSTGSEVEDMVRSIFTSRITPDSQACKNKAYNNVCNFTLSLIEPLSKMARLQHLGVIHKEGSEVPEGREAALATLLASLPMLESFSGIRIRSECFFTTGKEGEESVGWQLSRLKNLSSLQIISINNRVRPPELFSWASKITSLTLENDEVAHQVIDLFASTLKLLKLKPGTTPPTSKQLELPRLETLHLEDETNDPLSDFAQCSNIRQIHINIKSDYNWTGLLDLISTRTWPHLCHLQIIQALPNRFQNAAKVKLEEICSAIDVAFWYRTGSVNRLSAFTD